MFIVGATRSGTTSLYNYLSRHHDIYLSATKELNFFNVDTRYSDPTYYERMMPDYAGQRVIGDISPMYMLKGILYRQPGSDIYFDPAESAIRRLHETISEPKIILSLRHPIDRYISHYTKTFHQRKPVIERNINLQIRKDIETKDKALRNIAYANRYSIHLEDIIDLFGKDEILVTILEEWSDAPQAMLKDVFKFLDVDPDFDIGLAEVHNTSQGFKGSRIERRLRDLATKVGVNLPSKSRNKNLIVEPKSRALLYETLRDECSYVEGLLDRPIEPWRAINRRNEQLISEADV
jgi:hypothetical protein